MLVSEMIDTDRDDYTTKEIAALAGVSQAYLRRALAERSTVLRGRNVGGRLWLVRGSSLKRWFEIRETWTVE